MIDPKIIADAYLETWNAVPGQRRAALSAWRPDAVYTDPLMSGQGHEALQSMIDGAMTQFAGHRFALDGQPDGHGRFVRFSWTLRDGADVSVARGTDVIKLDDSGHIAEVIGFLDGVAQ
ncbi:MAG: nuclear transport factor 2 family protein [Pigmentiphaga sp.]|uniref:nuclear transport factor 2 family protein n=1 Tax=Pigmentiphaga sp. TaxID=1977564 RepID=UPI00299FA069|nr:nuclear transport factor 2 family protein [Pigmentiphaga sp.]MDX3905592.1 nuclear transport factor 2 family protein [Pigmentiphaga sp.]